MSALVSVIDGAAIVSVGAVVVVDRAGGRGLWVMAAACVAVVPVTVPSPTVNVSLASTTVSPLIVTDTSCDSPAVPAKCSVVVTSV